MYTQGDRRRDCRGDRRGDDCDRRPVYTLQAIVAATNTCLIEQPINQINQLAIVVATIAFSVYTGQLSRRLAIVAASVVAMIAATTAPTGCGDDCPMYMPYKWLDHVLRHDMLLRDMPVGGLAWWKCHWAHQRSYSMASLYWLSYLTTCCLSNRGASRLHV